MIPRRTWIVVFLFFLTAINYADRIVLSIAVGPISREFGFSPVQIGYLLSSFLWAYTLALIPMGYLVDRFPARGLCGWAIALWSAATMATGLGGNLITLIGMRLMMGMGESAQIPAGTRVIREWFPPRERGLANGALISGGLGGSALASLLIGGLMTVVGWRATFLCVGSIGLIWLAAWWRWFDVPERVQWLKPQERQLILDQRTPAASGDTPVTSFGRLLLSRSLWALTFTQGCGDYVLYLFLTWSPSYLQSVKHMSLARSGLVSAIPYLVACLAGILIGHLSDKPGLDESARSTRRRRYVVVSMLASSVVLLTPLFETPWAFVVFTSIALTGVTASFAQIYALVNDLLREERAHLGKCVAVVTVGANAFGMLAPIVTGYVVQSTHSFDSAYFVAGALLCLGAAACYYLARQPILPRTRMSLGEIGRDGSSRAIY